MTYDEHCKRLDALAGPGMAALEAGDEDAALLYVTAVIDYLLQHGEEMRADAPSVDHARLQEMKRTFRPILQAIEQRLGPCKVWQ
jgi:hypothetical protein